MILIVSSLQDDHAVAVMKRLDAYGARYVLLDTAAFPTKLQLSISYHHGVSGIALRDLVQAKDIDLRTVTAAWWRRPLPLVIHPAITDRASMQFTYNECFAAISGLWQMLDVFWINPPIQEEAATKKVFQLKVAASIGLRIPRTLVTNNPEEVRQFADTLPGGQLIYKSFQAIPEAWRETRLLSGEALSRLDDVKYAPVIFQEYIPADADLRVTIIGTQVFCIAVYTDGDHYTYDYRMNLDGVRVEPFELPALLKERLLLFMKQLGLVYGAIDLRYTPQGEFYFLEINPSGQWQFLEEKTDLDITGYFARFLVDPVLRTSTLHVQEQSQS